MSGQDLREALTSAELEALRQRNEDRARQQREAMGRKYLCHPTNRVLPFKRPGVLK